MTDPAILQTISDLYNATLNMMQVVLLAYIGFLTKRTRDGR